MNPNQTRLKNKAVSTTGCLRQRVGFTLIELLLVIAIIGILSGLSLLVLRGAEQDAMVSRTTSQVQRINQLLAGEWEGYQTRVLRFRFDQVAGYQNLTVDEIERIRSRALMDLARVEFPNSIDCLREFPSPDSQVQQTIVSAADRDYWPDVAGTNEWVTNYLNIVTTPAIQPILLTRFRREFNMQFSITNGNGVDVFVPADPNGPGVPPGVWSPANEQAECLYAILRSIRIDDINGLDYVRLRPNEVGDLDNDGYPEILDAFGEPLTFTFDDPNTVVLENGIGTLQPSVPLKTPFVVISPNMKGI